MGKQALAGTCPFAMTSVKNGRALMNFAMKLKATHPDAAFSTKCNVWLLHEFTAEGIAHNTVKMSETNAPLLTYD